MNEYAENVFCRNLLRERFIQGKLDGITYDEQLLQQAICDPFCQWYECKKLMQDEEILVCSRYGDFQEASVGCHYIRENKQ